MHDEILNGVPPPRREFNLPQVRSAGADRLHVITPQARVAQRKRAAEVAWIANREMRYDFPLFTEYEDPDGRDVHVFLYARDDRAIGLFIIEKRSRAIWRCVWTGEKGADCGDKLNGHPPMWPITSVWTHNTHRRRNIARKTVDMGLKHLGLDISSVGWYTPFTDSGEKLVRTLCPEGFYVVK
jgi:hypothetical protein